MSQKGHDPTNRAATNGALFDHSPAGNSCLVSASHRKGDFAREAFRLPVEAQPAFELASYHLLDDTHSEALACGHYNWRTAPFGPVDDEPPVKAARPFNRDTAFGHG